MGKISASHLSRLYFSGITLSHGSYAETIGLLHEVAVARRHHNLPIPDIGFTTLQGAEFGAPTTFKDNNEWLFGSQDDYEEFFDRLEKHQHPELLKRVEQWVRDGQADEPNPLVPDTSTLGT